MRNHAGLALLCVTLLSACGGSESPSPAAAGASGSGFGDVAFSTYEGDRSRVVFTTDTAVKKTWANMTGAAVAGTYTKAGNEIEIQWDPNATHHGSLSEKFRQMGPCSLARYVRVDMEGAVHDDNPQVYQRTKPICDTIRVTN